MNVSLIVKYFKAYPGKVLPWAYACDILTDNISQFKAFI